MDSSGFFTMNHLVISPKGILWLLNMALEMHLVHLPWLLRPMGTGLEGGGVVSGWD